MTKCLCCGARIKAAPYRYCSNKCQLNFQYYTYIEDWKKGKVTGNRGINTKNISRYLVRYLLEKYSGACALCGWNKINPTTGRVPLEVDHIDGNFEHNQEENLRLLCPNCHALTPNFRNLNKGSGRSWRRQRYVKVNA